MRDVQQHITGERDSEQAVGHGECGVTNGDLPLVEQLVRCIGDMPDRLAQHEVQDDDDSEQRELDIRLQFRGRQQDLDCERKDQHGHRHHQTTTCGLLPKARGRAIVEAVEHRALGDPFQPEDSVTFLFVHAIYPCGTA